MTITAYCLDWHIHSSPAFNDLLVNPLAPFLNIQLKSWNGRAIATNIRKDHPHIFCMLPPPSDVLNKKGYKLVWIPMWDQAQGYTDEWWNSLPKNLRVVAFSSQVYDKASAAGLKAIRLKYYSDPSKVRPARWDTGRVLFYWNRVGMVGPEFLAHLCQSLDIRCLLFKPVNDPRIESNKYYELPEKLGSTKVLTLGKYKDRSEFLRVIESSNIVLAPRLTEGVGMVFLEAMARGCAVIAHNAPTMNEYIDNDNGVLIGNEYTPPFKRFGRKFGKANHDSHGPYLLSNSQPWGKLSRTNYENLGSQALKDHKNGYSAWISDLYKFADFLLQW